MKGMAPACAAAAGYFDAPSAADYPYGGRPSHLASLKPISIVFVSVEGLATMKVHPPTG